MWPPVSNAYIFVPQSVNSGCKRAGFLSLNRISEMVWDTVSYEAGAPSGNTSVDEGGVEDEPGVLHLQPDRPTTRGHASSGSFSSNASNEEIFHSGPRQQIQTPSTSQWTRPIWSHRSAVHALEGAPNDVSSPLCVLLEYFVEIITPLVMESKRHYHGHLDRIDDGPLPLPDVTRLRKCLCFLR
jgi:hypothetical protein